jgi:hypothetical protein
MFIARHDLIYHNVDRLSYGVAVCDIDGDGQFEFFVTGFGYPNLALKWNGRGLLDTADAIITDSQRQAIGVAAADLDGDGIEEIYVLNSDTFAGPKQHGDRLFALHGGQRVDLFDQPEMQAIVNRSAGRSVTAIDRTGSGRYAFFVANYGAPMRLYELNQAWQLSEIARTAGVNYATGGRAVVAAPFFGNDVDLLAINERGPNLFFKNNGDGTFSDIATAQGISDRQQHGRGVAVFDANDDGQLDIAYGNWEGPHRLWVRGSDSAFRDIAPPALAEPSRIRTVIAADFDNDGNPELFFNNLGEPNRLFGRRNNQWVELDIGDAREPEGLGTGAAIADIDGDGRLELLIAHGESAPQPLSYYHVPANGNHWLRVRPLTRAGAPARGALVTINYADRVVAQVIDGGSGYLCQMEPTAHFGLGSHTTVNSLTIQWPSGTTTIIATPHIDQLLIIPHPAVDDDQIL